MSATKRVPLIFQSRVDECGLACLAMVAHSHGTMVDLSVLRSKYPPSATGTSLQTLREVAADLGLELTGVHAGPADLVHLELPAILHWQGRHFVVLVSVDEKVAVVHDPAMGMRRIPLAELARDYAGIAAQIAYLSTPQLAPSRPRLRLRDVFSGFARARPLILKLAFVTALIEALALTAPLLIKLVVDAGLSSGDLQLITALAVGFSLLACVRAGMTWLRGGVSTYFSVSLGIHAKERFLQRLLSLKPEWFASRGTGDVLSRFGSMMILRDALTNSLVETLIDGVLSIAILIVVFAFAPLLGLIALSAAIAIALVRAVANRSLIVANQARIYAETREMSVVMETVKFATAVKLFSREQARLRAWRAEAYTAANQAGVASRTGVRSSSLQVLVQLLEDVAIITVGAALIFKGSLTLGTLFAVYAYKSQFAARWIAFVGNVSSLRLLRVQLDRVADVLQEPPEAAPRSSDERGATAPDSNGTSVASTPQRNPHAATVRFEGLSFRYDKHSRWLLNECDLTVAAGERAAITGTSGCGKTTLLSLIAGLRSPERGRILIDDRDAREWDIAALRRTIGCVIQGDGLFQGSIAENITFFADRVDRVLLQWAVDVAGLSDDISQFPMGLETMVGEAALQLSGGQVQRVLLARALYKRPRLLLLDEATSHLDAATEQSVVQALNQIGSTQIIVAHRQDTIRRAHRVYRMQGAVLVPQVRDPATSEDRAMA